MLVQQSTTLVLVRHHGFVYDYLSGIATVGTGNTASGVLAGNVLKFVGADQTVYNGDFRVTEIIGISTFKVSVGVGTTAPTR